MEDVTIYLVLPISEDENLTVYQVVGVVEEVDPDKERCWRARSAASTQ